jgi:hypothetical protein
MNVYGKSHNTVSETERERQRKGIKYCTPFLSFLCNEQDYYPETLSKKCPDSTNLTLEEMFVQGLAVIESETKATA